MSSGNTLTATAEFESKCYDRVAHESTFAQDAPFSTGKRRSEIVGLRRLNLDLEHDRTMGTNLATDQEFSQLTRIQVKQ